MFVNQPLSGAAPAASLASPAATPAPVGAPVPTASPAMAGDTATLTAVATNAGVVPALGVANPRQAAAEAMLKAVDGLEADGKLTAPHATLLRGIAGKKTTTEQQLRLLTEGISHLGKHYNWGSTGPDQFDCSGLTLYCSKHVLGLDLPDTAANQMATLPQKIERAKLQPGDLVFFGKERITHVGIYLADNQMLEAGGEGQVNTDKGRVRIRSVRADYKGARRVVADSPMKPHRPNRP
jgi:cell wall-associated NlpC family hydrolase